VSVFPEHWELKSLSEVCELITDGSHFSPKTQESGIPYITVRDIQENSIDFNNCKFISNESFEELEKNGCRPYLGDILFSKDGTVGKVAQVTDETKFVVLSSLAILRPNSHIILPEFLKYSLKNPELLNNALGMKTGTAIRRIVLRNLKTLQIPLPPLNEQRKIVEILEGHLSRLDAAMEDVKQAKVKAARFRKSLLQAVFAGKFMNESGRGNANWAISELDKLCTFITDGSHNPPKGIEKSEYLMLSSRDINNGELTFEKPRYLSKKDYDSENKRTDLQIDDVLLTTVGTIGRTAIYSGVPKNVTFQRSVSVLRPNKEKISSKFLMYFLDSITDLLNQEARGVAQQGIYLNQVRKLRIPLPTSNEQLVLVQLLEDHLSHLDSSLQLVDLIENQASIFRSSLFRAAFTGQLTKEVSSV
jgi:type I restriction enzyme, S subunit